MNSSDLCSTYLSTLCIQAYACGSFPAKRSMKCKQRREINWGDGPSPFSPWFRHKAAGSVLIPDLESSPVNKSGNWGGCQTNWIVAIRLRPSSLLKWTGVFYNDTHVLSGSVQVIIWRLLIGDESRRRSICFTFKINHCLKTLLNSISFEFKVVCIVFI